MVLTFFVALAILETGLFLVSPVLQNHLSPVWANAFYVLLRVGTIIGFSYLCIRRHKKDIYGALSMTGLLLFVDQVGFKSLWLLQQIGKHPAEWQGIDTKSAIYNSAFSYVVSLPVILILAFLGALLALKQRRSRPPSVQAD